jgi:hypothetical protein
LRKENTEYEEKMTHAQLIAQLYAKVGPDASDEPDIKSIQQLVDKECLIEASNKEDLEENLHPTLILETEDDSALMEMQDEDVDTGARTGESVDNAAGTTQLPIRPTQRLSHMIWLLILMMLSLMK